jgi:ABC-type sugar transport system ATPase subunit
VILGVRPEDLRVVLPGQSVDPRSVISARVEMVELLGGEALVHCSSGGAELTARSPAPFSAEGAVGLEVPPERVHLFDGESRERLNL